MATLAKKLYLKTSAGAQQSANLYSTTDESQTPYLALKVDGVAAYAALVPPSDSRATAGRVKRTNGEVWAIGESGCPPYGYSLITTAGAGSFTVPTGVSKLRVTCVGGGAGGAGITIPNTHGTGTFYSEGGNATSFGSLTANGAGAGSVTGYEGQRTTYAVSQGSSNGAFTSSVDPISGGAAVSVTGFDDVLYGSFGKGGNMDSAINHGAYGGGAISGGAGYKTISFMDVSPGQVIEYNVGAGGRARWLYDYGDLWYNSTYVGSGCSYEPGQAGAILVEWGKGIQA